MKICRLFYFIAMVLTLTAFTITNGDYAELESLLNARAGFNFTKSAKNIQFQVPKGTVGKVLSFKQFHSGNYGIQLDLQNGKNKGEKVFVYFTPEKPNMIFTKENPLEKTTKKDSVTPEDAEYAKLLTQIRAYRAPSADPKPTAFPAATSKGVEGAVVQQVQQGIEKLRQVTAPAKCTDCEVAMAGKGSEKQCEEKRTSVGNLEVFQAMNNGKCEAGVYPNKEFKKKWPREYTVRGDGHFESLDSYGARSYYFFPRKNEVGYQISENGKSVILQTASDVKVEISAETGKVLNVIPATKWQEFDPNDEDNTPREKEHLAIGPIPGMMVMDLQYTMGAFPERKKSNSAFLKSPEGKSCRIPNLSIFKYNEPDGILDTVDFKFKTDQEFESFYKKQCKW